MFVPNATLSRILASSVRDAAPHEIGKIKALSAASAIGAAAYSHLAQAAPPPATGRRKDRRPLPKPLDEDTEAVRLQFHAADAELMIRAMIAAATADGQIDDLESRRIKNFILVSSGSPAESEFVRQQTLKPATPEELAEGVNNPETAIEIYAAALLATDAATPGSRYFLGRLSRLLNLDHDFVANLHRQWGDPPPVPA